jgi:hypothetical protein
LNAERRVAQKKSGDAMKRKVVLVILALVLVLGLVSAQNQIMEYRIMFFPASVTISVLQTTVNQIAADGWVLATAYTGANNGVYYVFTRPKTN